MCFFFLIFVLNVLYKCKQHNNGKYTPCACADLTLMYKYLFHVLYIPESHVFFLRTFLLFLSSREHIPFVFTVILLFSIVQNVSNI